MISIIVAVSEDWGIGKDNELLWHISEDLKRFKRLTSGNIVLTDNPNECIENSVTAYSIDDALSKCGPDEEIFIIGGGSIYRQFMPIADRLYITHVHKKAPADIYFPEIDLSIWEITEKEEFNETDSDRISYTYVIYERKNKNKWDFRDV